MIRDEAEERAARLAAQLRANLKQRKARTRGLDDAALARDGDERPTD